jgi:hypothetical protein
MSNVVGTWTVTTDFGCDGSIAGSFNQTFNADGSWTNTIGSNGRWYQVEGLVVWTLTTRPNWFMQRIWPEAGCRGPWVTQPRED